MEGSSSHASSSINLLCNEDQSCINDEDENQINNTQQFLLTPTCDLEYEVDYIKILVQKELNFESNTPCSSSSSGYPNWLKESRFEAINWILNTQALLRYGKQTAYLSVSYLDLFLSIRYIDENKLWAIRLLSVACLSLAAKMEECKVIPLSQYPVRDIGFDCQVIKKMELLILSTLNWKMILVTPFSYLHFFIKKLSDQSIKPAHDLCCKAVELLISILQEIRLTEHRPSMIAAAAVLAATDWQMSKENIRLKMSSVTLWETSDNLQQQEEQLYSCYTIMQRLFAKCNLSTPISLTGVLSPLTDDTPSMVGTKRSLAFSDSDPDLDKPEKIRRE